MSGGPISVEESFKAWRADPAYREAYEELEDEFALASVLIEARASAGLSQEELARRMGTSQPAVARLESGRANPTIAALRRYAQATGARLEVVFRPIEEVDAAKR